jgi:hypothetical protein
MQEASKCTIPKNAFGELLEGVFATHDPLR